MIDWFQFLTRGVIPLVGAAWLLVLQARVLRGVHKKHANTTPQQRP